LTAAGQELASVAWYAWGLLVLTSLCVYAFGMALNDLADRERDRVLAPDRPLPSGALSPRGATALVVLLGAAALALGGGPAGSRIATAIALLLALLYDVLLKANLAGGVATMGGVRFANAAIGVWPLVAAGAAPWTALLPPLAVGTWAAAVTLWSTTEEVDSARRRRLARALGVLAFGAAGALPWVLSGKPTLAVLLAGGVVTSFGFARTPRKGPAKRQVREMLLALYFLSACIATGADGGSMEASLASVGAAFVLVLLSQVWMRALARPPAA
jgi:4-hydroxybenzoate polyprenyltransferase